MIKEFLRRVTKNEGLPPRFFTDYDPAVILKTPPFFSVKVSDSILRANELKDKGQKDEEKVLRSEAADRARMVFDRNKVKPSQVRLRAGYGYTLVRLYIAADRLVEAEEFGYSLCDDESIPDDARFKIATLFMPLREDLGNISQPSPFQPDFHSEEVLERAG